MNSGREIELKYTIDVSIIGWSLSRLGQRIKSLPFIQLEKEVVNCSTKDYYFPSHNHVGNIRLRDSWGMGSDGFSKQLREITVKSKDQRTNFNRAEENIPINDCVSAYRALSLLFGTPILELHKDEEVFWTTDGMIISIASVNNQPKFFLEIEGPTEELVLKYSKLLEDCFDLVKEPRSLLEIFS